jgi:hypothetical protein
MASPPAMASPGHRHPPAMAFGRRAATRPGFRPWCGGAGPGTSVSVIVGLAPRAVVPGRRHVRTWRDHGPERVGCPLRSLPRVLPGSSCASGPAGKGFHVSREQWR